MTQLDNHIITSLESLSEEGKECARNMLGNSKPIVKEKDNIDAIKFRNWLYAIKEKNRL